MALGGKLRESFEVVDWLVGSCIVHWGCMIDDRRLVVR